jgi:hypothetical protein
LTTDYAADVGMKVVSPFNRNGTLTFSRAKHDVVVEVVVRVCAPTALGILATLRVAIARCHSFYLLARTRRALLRT